MKGIIRIALLVTGLAIAQAAAAQPPEPDRQRAAMVTDIRAMYRHAGTGTPDERVLEAIGRVPRHEFVPPEMVTSAYQNRPLPIGAGQTISQPYIVALMTDLARVPAGGRVLEVGTGSGYQAAILAEMGATVHTIEIIPALAATARERLARMGYKKIGVVTGDGYEGIPAHAPYDAILVTCGAPDVPPALLRQLKRGGRMVIPVGDPMTTQELTVVEKAADGTVRTRKVLPVRFVPLTR